MNPVGARQFGHRSVALDRCQRHLRLKARPMLLACLLHVLLPRHRRFLGAGLHLNQLSRFRGPAHAFPRVSHSRQRSRGSKSRGVATLPRRGGVTEWIRCTRPGVTAVGMPDARKTTEMLRQQAERCRRLAGAVTDAEVSPRLWDLANEFDARAAAEEERSRCR